MVCARVRESLAISGDQARLKRKSARSTALDAQLAAPRHISARHGAAFHRVVGPAVEAPAPEARVVVRGSVASHKEPRERLSRSTTVQKGISEQGNSKQTGLYKRAQRQSESTQFTVCHISDATRTSNCALTTMPPSEELPLQSVSSPAILLRNATLLAGSMCVDANTT